MKWALVQTGWVGCQPDNSSVDRMHATKFLESRRDEEVAVYELVETRSPSLLLVAWRALETQDDLDEATGK